MCVRGVGAQGDAVGCWRSLREEGVRLQESKVTNEKEKEGGARHLSLERSASSIE